MKYLKKLIFLACSLSGCNEKSNVVGDYKYSTRFIDSRISIYANGTFHQELLYSGKKMELDGQWNLKSGAIEFDKLYYLVDLSKSGEGIETREPKLYFLPSFTFSNDMLYVEEQKQLYRK